MTITARLRPLGSGSERYGAALAALLIVALAFGAGLVFAGQPLLAGLVAVALVALIACLAWPHAATYIVVAILYSNAAAVAVRHHGLPDIAGLAFPLLLVLPLADHLLLKRERITITTALPFLFGFGVVRVLGALGARDPSDALGNLSVFIVGGLGLYFIMTNVIRSFSALRHAVWTVLAVAAALGALSSFQALTGTYSSDYWGFSTVNLPGTGVQQVLASMEGTPRHEGPIGEINRYGQIMLVLLPIGVLLAAGESRPMPRLVALGLTFLILCGMVTSFSRGAFVGLVLILVVAVLFRYLRVVHIALLIGALAVLLVAFPRYGERIVDLQALTSLDRSVAGSAAQGDVGNLRGRTTSGLAAVLAWADHPVIGVGPGQFRLHYEEYAGAVADAGVDARITHGATREAHNLYAGVAAETGTVGFVLFMAIFLVTMRDLHRARRRWLKRRPGVAHLVSGFYLALVGYLGSGIGLHLSYERYLWFLLALAAVAAHLALKGLESADFHTEGDATRLARDGSPDGRTAPA